MTDKERDAKIEELINELIYYVVDTVNSHKDRLMFNVALSLSKARRDRASK